MKSIVLVSTNFNIVYKDAEANQASYDKKRQNEYLNDVEFVLQNIRTLDDSLSQKCEIPLWVNNCILSNEKADVLEIDKIEKQIQKIALFFRNRIRRYY